MKQFLDHDGLHKRLTIAHAEMHDTLGAEQLRVVGVWLECLGDMQIANILEGNTDAIAEDKTRAELFCELMNAVSSRRSTGHIF